MKRTKKERQEHTAGIKKCKCGNCLSLDSINKGIDSCPNCEPNNKTASEFTICCDKIMDDDFVFCPYCGEKII